MEGRLLSESNEFIDFRLTLWALYICTRRDRIMKMLDRKKNMQLTILVYKSYNHFTCFWQSRQHYFQLILLMSYWISIISPTQHTAAVFHRSPNFYKAYKLEKHVNIFNLATHLSTYKVTIMNSVNSHPYNTINTAKHTIPSTLSVSLKHRI